MVFYLLGKDMPRGLRKEIGSKRRIFASFRLSSSFPSWLHLSVAGRLRCGLLMMREGTSEQTLSKRIMQKQRRHCSVCFALGGFWDAFSVRTDCTIWFSPRCCWIAIGHRRRPKPTCFPGSIGSMFHGQLSCILDDAAARLIAQSMLCLHFWVDQFGLHLQDDT